jgi:hypothetical protein
MTVSDVDWFIAGRVESIHISLSVLRGKLIPWEAL